MSEGQKSAAPDGGVASNAPRIRWDTIRDYASRFEEYEIIAQTDTASRGRRHAIGAAAGLSNARFGPLEVGAEICAGWRVTALRATTASVQITVEDVESVPVVFDVGAPGTAGTEGPFDASPLSLTYRSNDLAFERFAAAGKALRDALRGTPGGVLAAWDGWVRDAERGGGVRRVRVLPDADALDIRADGKLYLRITDSCQERCKFCFFYDTDAVDNLVRHHDIDELVTSLDPEGVSQVILTGGEPTLHPKLAQYVAALYQKGFRQIIIQTNGLGFADGTLLEALRPFRDRIGIGFSLHSATEATNDVLTTVSRGYFQPKLDAIRQALALGFFCKITLVLSRHNLAELVDFVELCHRLRGGDELFLQVSLPSFQGRMLSFLETYPRLSELAESLPPALARARELDLRIALCHQCQVPPCILPDDAQHLESLWFCETPEMWTKDDRAYGPRCGECSMRPWCSGVWKGYADAFGTGELEPFGPGEVERLPR